MSVFGAQKHVSEFAIKLELQTIYYVYTSFGLELSIEKMLDNYS